MYPVPSEAEACQTPQAPTLLEDWLARKRFLTELADSGWNNSYAKSGIRIFDFLLKQYSEDAVARVPARFPLPSCSPLFYDHRVAVVFEHLGKRKKKAKSVADVTARVTSALSRIASQDPQKSLSTPGSGKDLNRIGVQREKIDLARSMPNNELDQKLEQLASAHDCERRKALIYLDECGTLDEIGFLNDLLLVTPADHEKYSERELMLDTIRGITERCTGKKFKQDSDWYFFGKKS